MDPLFNPGDTIINIEPASQIGILNNLPIDILSIILDMVLINAANIKELLTLAEVNKIFQWIIGIYIRDKKFLPQLKNHITPYTEHFKQYSKTSLATHSVFKPYFEKRTKIKKTYTDKRTEQAESRNWRPALNSEHEGLSFGLIVVFAAVYMMALAIYMSIKMPESKKGEIHIRNPGSFAQISFGLVIIFWNKILVDLLMPNKKGDSIYIGFALALTAFSFLLSIVVVGYVGKASHELYYFIGDNIERLKAHYFNEKNLRSKINEENYLTLPKSMRHARDFLTFLDKFDLNPDYKKKFDMEFLTKVSLFKPKSLPTINLTHDIEAPPPSTERSALIQRR